MSYLSRLTGRLATALAAAPAEFRERHRAFLLSRRQADGGFPGREGGSDLYYTGFALRALAALGALDAEIAAAAGGFLRSRLTRQASIIDFVSLLYGARLVAEHGGPDVLNQARADWAGAVTAALETYRGADGGYAKTLENNGSSTYHTFLVALCCELAGIAMPDPASAVRFVLSRRRDDGGFVEIGAMKRSGTNPTAAAIALLAAVSPPPDVLPEDQGRALLDGAVEFLAGVQSPMEGGFAANTRAPACDLLSTFTALLTLRDLGAADRVDLDAVRRYVAGCDRPEGGFTGGLWDAGADAEYTFYGLGATALLSEAAAARP
jgi:geranylgeranyl transferase type-2 subunit beta